MQTQTFQASLTAKTHSAVLIQSRHITPPSSPEEVLHLVFSTSEASFDAVQGNCIRVFAPGQFGNRHHTRLYSIMDLERRGDTTEFAICVRRCFYVDDFNGEKYRGVASNYLCDLRPDDILEFSGPVGYPFAIPDDKTADILMLALGTGIAPFRNLIRQIYEKIGGWKGRVRLFYGAKSPLEMLYMNDENNDLANYYDQPTFKAFQAVSPRPHFDAPVALDQALEMNASEVWDMVNRPNTHVFVAGTENLLETIEQGMCELAGSPESWAAVHADLVSSGRWSEVLY